MTPRPPRLRPPARLGGFVDLTPCGHFVALQGAPHARLEYRGCSPRLLSVGRAARGHDGGPAGPGVVPVPGDVRRDLHGRHRRREGPARPLRRLRGAARGPRVVARPAPRGVRRRLRRGPRRERQRPRRGAVDALLRVGRLRPPPPRAVDDVRRGHGDDAAPRRPHGRGRAHRDFAAVPRARARAHGAPGPALPPRPRAPRAPRGPRGAAREKDATRLPCERIRTVST